MHTQKSVAPFNGFDVSKRFITHTPANPQDSPHVCLKFRVSVRASEFRVEGLGRFGIYESPERKQNNGPMPIEAIVLHTFGVQVGLEVWDFFLKCKVWDLGS